MSVISNRRTYSYTANEYVYKQKQLRRIILTCYANDKQSKPTIYMREILANFGLLGEVQGFFLNAHHNQQTKFYSREKTHRRINERAAEKKKSTAVIINYMS